MGENTTDRIDGDSEPTSGSSGNPSRSGRDVIEVSADDLYGDIDRLIDRTSGDDGNDGDSDGGVRSRATKRTNRSSSGSRNTAQSRKPTAKKSNPSTVTTVENVLHSIHFMLAKSIKVQELELSKEESAKLAEAIHAVQVEYDFVVDPKVVAWGGLIGTASAVYMPRFMAYKMRMQIEAKRIANEKQMETLHASTT